MGTNKLKKVKWIGLVAYIVKSNAWEEYLLKRHVVVSHKSEMIRCVFLCIK